MTRDRRLRKLLTHNDVGQTGSHQAGFHVSKDLVDFFPGLDAKTTNPRVWLQVTASGAQETWRYIHYNNKLTSGGTRDEFRITHVRKWMERIDAQPGDIVELERTGASSYRADLIRDADSREERLQLDSRGRWMVVALRR